MWSGHAGAPSSPSARESECLPPEGLTGFSSLSGPCVAAQVDGESEEEQESAGTADEEEDGDESDLVTPACARDESPGSCPMERPTRRARRGLMAGGRWVQGSRWPSRLGGAQS